MNALYKCRNCYGYTPRDLKYCNYCDVKLPDKELAKNVKNNDPQAHVLPWKDKKQRTN